MPVLRGEAAAMWHRVVSEAEKKTGKWKKKHRREKTEASASSLD